MPAGLAAEDAWRLWVDDLLAQPLAWSVSEVEAFGAQARSADFVCEEGWMVPEQHREGVPGTAALGRAGVDPVACFLKVYAGNFPVLLPLQEVPHGWAILARTLNGAPLTPEHRAP